MTTSWTDTGGLRLNRHEGVDRHKRAVFADLDGVDVDFPDIFIATADLPHGHDDPGQGVPVDGRLAAKGAAGS